jgi:hypothetical protein
MTSLLLDKLEILKSNEIKIKEEQRFLVEQISLEMEKKRRLKLEGTLKKLEVQVDNLAENFEGEIMTDNSILVLKFGKHNYTREEQQEIEKGPVMDRRGFIKKKFITLEKFNNNLGKIEEWSNTLPINQKNGMVKSISRATLHPQPVELLEIPHDIKFYSDMVPLFRTMIGIMEKQQKEIDELKSKFKNKLIN